MIVALLALHLVVGIAIIAGGRRLGRRSAWLAASAPLPTLVWLAAHLHSVTGGRAETQHLAWIPALGVNIDLRLDALAAVMVLLVSGIGVLVFAYSARYLPESGPGVGRLIGLLTLFGGAMVGLVVADNLLVLYGFWELTSVTSFFLIGNDHQRPGARAAALHALLVTGAGALAMLGGFLLLGHAAGTYRLSAIIAHPPLGTTVSVALVLILLGAFSKSAQYPFHAWLPGAMVAPTPVSAYLHSATMVKAGVYLIARLAPAFAPSIGWWRPVVVTVGLLTLVLGGLRALRQHDLKVLLAHGTVSQLGLMVAVFGIGTPTAIAAGTLLLVAHGAFKATAFMTVGIIDHQVGTRDLRCLPRLGRGWRTTATAVVVCAASMAGIPPLVAFVAKEGVLQALLDTGGSAWRLALGVAVFGSMLTVAYSAKFAWGALGREASEPVAVDPVRVGPSFGFVAPALVLTAVTVALGAAPQALGALVGAVPGLHGDATPHLALWHGLNTPLALSALVIAGGATLVGLGARVAPLLARGRHLPDAGDVYVGTLRGLNRLADRTTSISQPGSLPIYAGVILATAAVLPLWALTTGPSWPGWPQFVDTPAQLFVAVVLVGAALAASAVRRRFSAALFLGVAGYAMAGLFVVQGAPDLALTQVAIETLSTVLFVLVLRRLPDQFSWSGRGGRVGVGRRGGIAHERDPAPVETGPPADSPMTTGRRALRVGVALAVGASVFVFAIVMSGPQPSTPTSQQAIERAEPDGHGRNVVNVILVDFRGFDTLGEIAVLASAAIGTVALARAGRRPRTRSRRSRRDAANELTGPGLPAGPVAPALDTGRSVTLEVSVRIVFAIVMVASIYLLYAGHNQPGGGFVGGILAGAAVALRYIAGGIDDVRRLSRGRPWLVLGFGLALAAITATAPLLWGRAVLTTAAWKLHLPVLHTINLTSATVFDLGVYLVVFGVALMVFESFGDEPDPDTTDLATNLPVSR